MNLNEPTEENLKYILDSIATNLNVANRALLDPVDYNIEKYEELKFMYDMLNQKGKLSPYEADAFIKELATTRKK